MNKWVLLSITVFMVYGAVQSIRWLRTVQKAPSRDIEKIVGLDTSGLSAEQKQNVARYSMLPMGLPAIPGIMIVLALAMLALTIRAFLE